ncbi:DEAD-domain-containing protein [Irpex lacteus]|nr:DEAD-domain-containing protein [Irpex lacteus]
MVVRWLGTGLTASAVITRTSRFGIIRAGPVSARLSSSAAVRLRPASSQQSPVEDAPASSQSDAVSSDQPEFSTLQGRVSEHTLQAITRSPFNIKHMSPVQAAVLPLLPDLAKPYDPEDASTSPRDLLVKARTGTGKTLAFLIPAIEARMKALDKHAKQAVADSGLKGDRHLEDRAKRALSRREVGALILSPTRELATQIANEAIKLSSHHHGFEVRLFVGGVSKYHQMKEWMKGRRDIVVGTPGRIRDVLENEPTVRESLATAKMFILDEADTLLDMGFRGEIDAIAEFLPPTPERQTFMFSATVSPAIRDVAREILNPKHKFVNCVSNDAPPVHAHIPQHYTVLPDASQQFPHVLRLLAQDQLTNVGNSKTIVFLPTTKMTKLFSSYVSELAEALPAGKRTRIFEIHSLLNQGQRTRTSDKFRNDNSGASILVSSDVSARGVDYPGVTRVIQVGVPASADQYVHRVGRTGRGAERRGRADLVLLPFESGFVKWQLHNIPIKPVTVEQLESEVLALAQAHDSDAKGFMEANSSAQRAFESRSLFVPKVLPGLEGLNESIATLHQHTDPDAAKDTVASMLGYYVGRISDIRCRRDDILNGLKEWTVQACGLPTAPHFSHAFLTRLGFGSGEQEQRRSSSSSSRRGGFGMRPRDSSFSRGDKPSYQRNDRPSYQRNDDSSYQRNSRDFDSRPPREDFSRRRDSSQSWTKRERY